MENDIFWSEVESGFGEPGSTPPKSIPRNAPPPPPREALLYVTLCFPHHVTSLHLALLLLRNLLLQPVIRFVWGIMIDSLIGYTLFINGSTFWPFYGSCFYSFFIVLQVLRYTCAIPFHGHIFKEANLGQSTIQTSFIQLSSASLWHLS